MIRFHSISAQSNFAVGAVVNATFGSITEMTFYITALLRGQRAASKCYEEIVKAALTGTLLGCILFIPVSWGDEHEHEISRTNTAKWSNVTLCLYLHRESV